MPDLLVQGLTLAAYGMGTVFTFLSLLVGITALMSKLVNRFVPVSAASENPPPGQAQTELSDPVADGNISPQVLAVISGAISTYRNNNKQ